MNPSIQAILDHIEQIKKHAKMYSSGVLLGLTKKEIEEYCKGADLYIGTVPGEKEWKMNIYTKLDLFQKLTERSRMTPFQVSDLIPLIRAAEGLGIVYGPSIQVILDDAPVPFEHYRPNDLFCYIVFTALDHEGNSIRHEIS